MAQSRNLVAADLFPLADGESATLYIPNLSNDIVKLRLDDLLSPDRHDRRLFPGQRQAEVARNIVSVSNVSETTYEQLCKMYYTIGPDRKESFREAVKVVFANPFKETADDCADVELGRTLMKYLQSQLNPFMLNVLPLFRVYRSFNTPSTLALLSDYLYREINNQSTQDQTKKILHDNIDVLFSLYADDLSDGARIFQGGTNSRWNWQWGIAASHKTIRTGPTRYQPDLTDTTYDKKLKFITYKYLVSTFERLGTIDDVMYQSLPYNYYNPQSPLISRQNSQTVIHRYGNFLLDLFKTIRSEGTPEQQQFFDRLIAHKERRGQGNWSEFQSISPIEDEELEDFYAVGAYYVPAPMFMALYMISYSATVATSKTYSQYQIGLETATQEAKNQLIELINPAFVPTPLLIKFPKM